MKKLLLFTTLSAITVIMATPTLALQFENEKDAEAYFAEEARIWQKIRENMEKGKTDSDALGKAIDIIFDLHLMGTMDNPVLYTQKHMKEVEISQEQQIKTLERMTRERLTAIEKDEKINTTVHVVHLLPMLGAISDYDMLPILKECALSKDNRIRANTLEITEKIITKLEEKKQTADVEKFATFLKEMKQAEQKEQEKP